MNKCTLIIDGNWLLMSRLGLYLDRFKKDRTDEEKRLAQTQFIDFLAKSINVAINRFPSIVDNVLLVQDGGSWRKSLKKPNIYKDEVYKGTRKKDDSIDWTYVFGALTQLCKNFRDNNITCVCEGSIEGDDWAWFWSRYLNSKKTNCIIWTSDCDLKQLVQRDDNTDAWTAWFNDKAGLVLPKCFDINIDIMDLFMYGTNENPYISLLRKDVADYHDTNYINPHDIINEKIVCGDTSDNIKSLVRVQGEKKTTKISAKDWTNLKEEYNIKTENDLENNIDNIITELLNTKKFKKCPHSLQDIKEAFEYNKQLVWLDESVVPAVIQSTMTSHIADYKICDIEYLRNNYKVLANEDDVDFGEIDEFMEGLI